MRELSKDKPIIEGTVSDSQTFDKKVGRHCRICGKPGGTSVRYALRGIGLRVDCRRAGDEFDEQYHPYAHALCVWRVRQKQRKGLYD